MLVTQAPSPPPQASAELKSVKRMDRQLKRLHKQTEGNQKVHTSLKEHARSEIEREQAEMTEEDRNFYERVTKELDRDRPVQQQPKDRATALLQLEDLLQEDEYEVVDVLDDSCAVGNKERALNERVYKDGSDQVSYVRTNAVLVAGHILEADIFNTLKAHQKDGVETVLRRFAENKGVMLAHGTGVGKTLEALAVMQAFKSRNPDARYLVVCPRTLILQWKQQIEHYFGSELDTYGCMQKLDVCPRYGTLALWRKHGGVALIGFELFRDTAGKLSLTADDVVVVDEAQQQLKSASTLLHKAFEMLPCKRRLFLSGSPLQNSLEELFNMVQLLEPGIIGADYSEFQNRYGRAIEQGMKRDSTNDELKESRVMSHVLRRILSASVAHFVSSEEVLESVVPNKMDWLLLCDTDAATMDQLADGTGGAFELRNQVHVHTLQTKTEVTKRLLQSFAARVPDEIVLIFSQRRETLDHMHSVVPGVGILHGHASLTERQDMIEKLRNTPGGILYVMVQVGATGLDLHFASRVVLMDVSWNPMADMQATARAHRIGQTRTVHVYRLCMRGTYEERAYWLGVNKGFLAGTIVKDKDVVRVYEPSELNADEDSGSGHYADKAALNDSCLKQVAIGCSWINVINHDAVTEKQGVELTSWEMSEAENRYNFMSNVPAPVITLDWAKPWVSFMAGVEHLHLRIPRTEAESFTLLYVASVRDCPLQWKPCCHLEKHSEDQYAVHGILRTSVVDKNMLMPGEYIFKSRAVGETTGDFSSVSAIVFVA